MYGSKPEIGPLGVWTGQFDQQPIGRVRDVAAELEDVGYSALWLGETFGREAMTQSALVLGATKSMTVATGVASVYGRDPVTMAQAQRTLLESYGDRFVLGLGISHPWTVTQIRGAAFGPRIPTMRAYLDKMDATTAGPPGAGRPGARVLGAVGPRMLSLAAEKATGALPLGMPVEHTERARALLGPEAFLGVIQAVLLTTDADRAQRTGRQYVAELMPNRADILRDLGYSVDLSGPHAERLVQALVAAGDVESVAARVRDQMKAGADHVCVYVIGVPGDELPRQQWRALSGVLS
jgi:probable F420-dependent oxidoreductase